MIASSDPRWLQWAFTVLVGLFDRVGLKTNQRKKVSMTCRPCSTPGNRLEASYEHIMTASVHAHLLSLAFLCCVMRCESSDPAAISCPQYPHVTRSLFLSLGVGQAPVIMCLYDASDLFPGVLHGLHVMLTVFVGLSSSLPYQTNPLVP